MVGRVNTYTCQKCGKKFTTVDKDKGVTPFIIKCRDDECDGSATSAFYMSDQSLTPEYEFYKPNDDVSASLTRSPESTCARVVCCCSEFKFNKTPQVPRGILDVQPTRH